MSTAAAFIKRMVKNCFPAFPVGVMYPGCMVTGKRRLAEKITAAGVGTPVFERSMEVNMAEELELKEEKLQNRLQRIQALEEEVSKKEKALKEKEKSKKQMLLRLSPGLWDEIAAWAEDDFRSVNSQVEYLLSECVRKRKSDKKSS